MANKHHRPSWMNVDTILRVVADVDKEQMIKIITRSCDSAHGHIKLLIS